MISVKNVLIKLKLLKMCFLKRECEQNIQEGIRSRGPDCWGFQRRALGKEAVRPSLCSRGRWLMGKAIKIAIKKTQGWGLSQGLQKQGV